MNVYLLPRETGCIHFFPLLSLVTNARREHCLQLGVRARGVRDKANGKAKQNQPDVLQSGRNGASLRAQICLTQTIQAAAKQRVETLWRKIYRTTALISYASKVMLKIFQARLQQYMNCELPDVQAGFRKGRGTRYQIANICWIIEKAREFQKNIYFCFIDYAKAFDCVEHNKLWKILKEMGIPDHLTCLLRNLYAVRKQQLELDMDQ